MIVNRYKVDDAVIEQTCTYTVKSRLKPIRILCWVSVLIFLYLIMVVTKGMELPLVIALVFVILFRFMVLPAWEKKTIRKYIETITAKNRATYGKKPLWEEVRIENGIITTYSNKVKAFSFPIADVKKVFTTDRFYILLFKNNPILTLDRSCFYDGSEAELKELIKAVNKKALR